MGKRILLIANEYTTIVNFRMELIAALIEDGNTVSVALPEHERNEEIRALGCETIDIRVSRKGMNPLKEIQTVKDIKRAIDYFKPDIAFTFTIKPNVYGGFACANRKVPYVANITGLGTAVENGGLMQVVTSTLYKIGLWHAQKVFFQNQENLNFMVSRGIYKGPYELIPGSGVNLTRFRLIDYPSDDTIRFAYVARVMKEKGIDQFFDAAQYIRQHYPDTEFHICGACEGAYEEKLDELSNKGVVIYHGMVKDMTTIYKSMHCTVLPTFYPEGMSNVLLESAACGIPIITTNRAGCREIVDDGINGYVVRQEDSQDLIEKIERFLSLSYERKKEMGLAGRRKVEREFDRNIVVGAYMSELRFKSSKYAIGKRTCNG